MESNGADNKALETHLELLRRQGQYKLEQGRFRGVRESFGSEFLFSGHIYMPVPDDFFDKYTRRVPNLKYHNVLNFGWLQAYDPLWTKALDPMANDVEYSIKEFSEISPIVIRYTLLLSDQLNMEKGLLKKQIDTVRSMTEPARLISLLKQLMPFVWQKQKKPSAKMSVAHAILLKMAELSCPTTNEGTIHGNVKELIYIYEKSKSTTVEISALAIKKSIERSLRKFPMPFSRGTPAVASDELPRGSEVVKFRHEHPSPNSATNGFVF